MTWSEADIPSQEGRLVAITGTGGLGYEAARALAQAGASVVLAGRNPSKGNDAVARIRRVVPTADIRLEQLDLASLGSVQAFSDRMLAADIPLDVLVNNAGVAIVPTRRETEDGFELQLGTNHLGHFALTMRLMPLLLRAPRPRVVSLSSNMHKSGLINLDDLQSRKSYSASGAYAQSKLATLVFALELDRRAKTAGLPLLSNAAHPGIARTDLMSNGPTGRPVLQMLAHLIERLLGQSAAAGTLPLLRAATDPATRGGEYYGPGGYMEMKGPPRTVLPSPAAQDHALGRRLWDASVTLTGLDLVFPNRVGAMQRRLLQDPCVEAAGLPDNSVQHREASSLAP